MDISYLVLCAQLCCDAMLGELERKERKKRKEKTFWRDCPLYRLQKTGDKELHTCVLGA